LRCKRLVPTTGTVATLLPKTSESPTNMSSRAFESRLSNITTNWDELVAAHGGKNEDRDAAMLRSQILRRYAGCVYQYTFGATKSHHAAEDLTQEFALRFVRGDFRKANPSRGRFRDYLKASLRNLITDFYRSQMAEGVLESSLAAHNAALKIESLEVVDIAFSAKWRERVLSITWGSLQSFESEKSNYFYSILRLRAENPESSSIELAKQFDKLHNKKVSSDWIRQNLRRARRKFGELLIEEVSRTLNSTDRDDLDAELASLGLKKYVAGLDL